MSQDIEQARRSAAWQRQHEALLRKRLDGYRQRWRHVLTDPKLRLSENEQATLHRAWQIKRRFEDAVEPHLQGLGSMTTDELAELSHALRGITSGWDDEHGPNELSAMVENTLALEVHRRQPTD